MQCRSVPKSGRKAAADKPQQATRRAKRNRGFRAFHRAPRASAAETSGSQAHRPVTEFTAADFAPLDDFPLLGRWVSRTHERLPARALRTIRPLTPAVAARIGAEAAVRGARRPVSELELAIRAEWDAPEPVRQRLAALPIAGDVEVVLSWDPAMAVVTRWGTFVRYWHAFCYPSSDDVTAWAPGGDWTLSYHHVQFIEFGRTPPAT